MTLRELPAGESARVIGVRGDSPISKRLMEMGVVPGVDIRVVRSTVWDPMEIRVLVTTSLSVERAASIGSRAADPAAQEMNPATLTIARRQSKRRRGNSLQRTSPDLSKSR
jgi:Fe2+ transport system protein FeoA